jgi:ribonucleoside-diphosphate reductase alpha chain
VQSAWKTGEPGCVFLDIVNKTNPLPGLGRIEACNPCVTADTWISTSSGPRKVKELVGKRGAAEKVLVPRTNEMVKSTGFFSTGIKPVFRILTDEGFEIKCTANHRLMAVDGTWIATENLRPGSTKLFIECKEQNWNGRGSSDEGYLLGCALGRKQKGETLADDIESMSKEFYRGFFRGLLDAKCPQHEHERLVLIHHEFSTLQRLQRMLCRLGVMSRICQSLSDSFELEISAGQPVRKFLQIVGLGEEKSSSREEEEEEKLEEVTVKEVQECGEAEVYDVTVEHEFHCYESNGFVSHNCGEQFLHDGDVCNLGSINLEKFVLDGKVNYDRLDKVTQLAVRMLDNVIDLS